MNITDAIKRVRSSGARHGTGAPPEQIRDAEAKLGLALPASYRRFLESLGWAETDDFVVYGLGDDLPPLLDLVVSADLERSDDPDSAMPPHLLPICPDGMGNHECLDTSKEHAGDCPVVYWGRTTGRAIGMRPSAPTFAAWLAARFADAEPPPRTAGRAGVKGRGRASPGRSADREITEPTPGESDEARRGRLEADPQIGDLARGPDDPTPPPS
jgi:antitoxin YobK